MRIQSVVNQKGGCGKTTITVNLASALARAGSRVLVVDNDPQGHATQALGLAPGGYTLTTRDLYLTSDVGVEDACVRIRPDLDLVPADIDLASVEQELDDGGRRVRRLLESFARSSMPYDLVLLDNPPNVGLLTFNSLMASEEALVPVDAGRFAVDAVGRLQETVDLLASERGHRVRLHLVPSGFDVRTRYARGILDLLDELYPGARLGTIIHQTVRLREAAAAGEPIDVYDPASRATEDFAALAAELRGFPLEILRTAPHPWSRLLHGARWQPGRVELVADFPGAGSVAVTGDFNGWSVEGDPLDRDDEGRWRATLDVDPGCYEYKFIVDGVWKVDPANPERVRNTYGQVNSVLVVSAGG